MESLLVIFLLLGPFLDVTAYCGLPVNIVVRGIYLLTAIVILIVNKKSLKTLAALLIFSIGLVLFQKLSLDFSLKDIVSNTFKFLYLPVSILFFKDYEFKKWNKNRVLTLIIFTYLGTYLLSYITKIGENAYLLTDGKKGFKGLFSSINEFSAIVVGLLPIVSSYLKEKKRYIILGLLFICAILTSLLMGTKVLLAGILVTIVYLLYKERDVLFKKRSSLVKILIIIGSILLVGASIFLFTKTRTYKNMLVQQDFFKADNIGDFINYILFNNRLSFLDVNFNYFLNRNVLDMLLGIGMNNSLKLVEIDAFDLLFRYGIIGFILFGFAFTNIKFKDLKDYEKLSFILMIIASLTSGHVLMYPNVCIYIGLLLAKNIKE